MLFEHYECYWQVLVLAAAPQIRSDDMSLWCLLLDPHCNGICLLGVLHDERQLGQAGGDQCVLSLDVVILIGQQVATCDSTHHSVGTMTQKIGPGNPTCSPSIAAPGCACRIST